MFKVSAGGAPPNEGFRRIFRPVGNLQFEVVQLSTRRTGLVGIVLDISDNRRSKQALAKANRLLTMAEETVRYGHCYYDIATGQSLWSKEV